MRYPHVEFANSVWCPYKIGDLKEIEKIQKRATKLVIKRKNKSYIDRYSYTTRSLVARFTVSQPYFVLIGCSETRSVSVQLVLSSRKFIPVYDFTPKKLVEISSASSTGCEKT